MGTTSKLSAILATAATIATLSSAPAFADTVAPLAGADISFPGQVVGVDACYPRTTLEDNTASQPALELYS